MAVATRSSKLTGSAAGVLAYLQDEDATLRYYDAEEGFPTVWGKGAKALGLDRGVSREQFLRLFHGQNPDTGEQLAKTGYKRVEYPDGTEEMVAARTGAVDIVYGAPKSLAVLYVEATPDLRRRLDEMVLNAAHAASMAVQDHAKFVRVAVKTPTAVGGRSTKQQGSATERQTADMIVIPTLQYTARPTEESERRSGIAVDPQIHVHCTTMTLARSADGRWLTGDEYSVKNRANAKYRDSVFLGELARGLESLGVQLDYNEFERARGGEVRWEVKGTDPELRRYWSTNNERAWKIRREYEEKHGKPIDEVKLGEILYKTRKHKTKAVKQQDSHPNWDLWRADALRAGFRLGIAEPQRSIEHDAFRAADTLRERLLSANGLCNEDAVFDEASIRPAIARCGVGLGFSPAELDGCARAMLEHDGRDLVLVRDAVDPENRLYTTKTVLKAEASIATTREQKAGRWVDITGKAGTGKSRLTATAVEALRSLDRGSPITESVKAALDRQDVKLDDEQIAGVHAIVRASAGADNVVVVSMAASTAERTGLKVKADSWGSVESVVSRIEKGTIKVSNRTLVVIEESGQLDTLRMDKLLKAVGDASIVTLGDTRQLSAIGAAGWYTDALERHGSIELTEVRRQKDPQDVADYALVRDGRAREALESLQGRDRVHTAVDDAERMGRVFQDYRQHRETGRLARDVRIVLDASNQEVDLANRFVQRDRLQRQEISPVGVDVESEDQGRRWTLRENDQIIMLSTVRVRGDSPVKNGTTGVIKRLDDERQRARLKLDDGREVTVPLSASIGLGYACHAQKFQGGETPVALVVPGSSTSRNSGYTMLTRGVEESHVYASEEAGGVEALAERWTRTAEKESARTAIARVREEEPLLPLPPVRSDDLVHDIKLDPVPELQPVRGYEEDPLRQVVEDQQLIEPSLDDDLDGPSMEF